MDKKLDINTIKNDLLNNNYYNDLANYLKPEDIKVNNWTIQKIAELEARIVRLEDKNNII